MIQEFRKRNLLSELWLLGWDNSNYISSLSVLKRKDPIGLAHHVLRADHTGEGNPSKTGQNNNKKQTKETKNIKN